MSVAQLTPAMARELLKVPEIRRIVEQATVQVNAEEQALRLEAWQQATGRKHPAGRSRRAERQKLVGS